jgi:hypothetical protein
VGLQVLLSTVVGLAELFIVDFVGVAAGVTGLGVTVGSCGAFGCNIGAEGAFGACGAGAGVVGFFVKLKRLFRPAADTFKLTTRNNTPTCFI